MSSIVQQKVDQAVGVLTQLVEHTALDAQSPVERLILAEPGEPAS